MLMPMPRTPPLRSRPVSQTPTDDQLGDQQYGAGSAAGGADSRTVRHVSAGAEAVFGPAGAGGDLAATSSVPGSLAIGRSRAVPDAARCRDAPSDEERGLTQRYPIEPQPASSPAADARAAQPVSPSKERGGCARLANSDAGNLYAMVRSGYCAPSYGTPVQRLASPRLDVSAPATTRNATALRRTFSHWVHSLITDDAAEDLTLAVYEALTNAAEHAFTGHRTTGCIWLHAIVADGQITVTVTDNGRWRHPTDSGGYRGRGLPLMHQLTTETHVAPSPYGTTVRLRHQLH
jgi:serine/threonine-protein kinase RsbW